MRLNKNFIKEQLTTKVYCSTIGTMLDLNHFKHKTFIQQGSHHHDHNYVFHFNHGIHNSKKQFFHDCYYLNLINNYEDVHELLKDQDILNLYKEGHGNYSVYTPIILAEEVSVRNKRKFVKILSSYGFIPTANDIMIQKLEIYESISIDVKNKVILFLQTRNILPEIKWNIVEQLVLFYKTNYKVI